MKIRQKHLPELGSLIFEHMSTAILVFDADLRLTYLNPAAEMLFAVSARQVVGSTAQDLLPAEPTFHEHLRKAIRTGQGMTERELALMLNSEKKITVDCTVTSIRSAAGAELALVEIMQVDHHLRISREERLQAQNIATRALVRGFAHEVKNPLGGLRGAAQLLECELADESLKEYTQIIISEADRLQKLVDEMLGPNRLPKKTLINIHEVLERVRSLVLAEVPDGVQIRRNYDPSIPEFVADRDQLLQAVLNIVQNAIQALEGNGTIELKSRIERQFTIGNVRHRHVLRIDIKDNGPGIPEDMQQKIFFPMVTSRAEGTGVGLSIAQSLISRHDGLIECSSSEKGTKFTILLPLETEMKDDG
ncbi:nitrogen regulation protein NR(II) [Sulfuriflexus sp.]|uniref:nitrogen regulation protein NR(II) n=1 Tax=Sulfuriflexus sp. TaxID=2015443 RepID=UPI0028CCEA78|nr:nitrogen regulation protein NR(II) [Sulfuriflexus sp.]MDT8404074.1 nitrogen regulation protein NR(II) [Sulfuriflexus sp.]